MKIPFLASEQMNEKSFIYALIFIHFAILIARRSPRMAAGMKITPRAKAMM